MQVPVPAAGVLSIPVASSNQGALERGSFTDFLREVEARRSKEGGPSKMFHVEHFPFNPAGVVSGMEACFGWAWITDLALVFRVTPSVIS